MQKNSVFAAILLLFSTSCVSVLSQVSDEDAWNDYFKEIKVQQFQENRSIASESNPAVIDAQSGVKILRQILEGMPFRSYLVSCDNEQCYREKLALVFDQSFLRVKEQNIKLSAIDYNVEQKLFLENYSYSKVLNWIETFHRMILSGVELRTAKRALELAQICESSLSSEEENHISSFSPYLGGTTYLPRSYYLCLNEHWQNELDLLLKETTDRLGIVIKTNEAKRWILQRQMTPIYTKTLNDIFEKHKKNEITAWLDSSKEIYAKIDWKEPIEEIIQNEVPMLRKNFHSLNLEAILTEKKMSKK